MLRVWKHSQSAADVAQSVEQLICNQQVKGSSPFVSSRCRSGRRRPWPDHFARRSTHTPRQVHAGCVVSGIGKLHRCGGASDVGETWRGGVPEWPKGADCKSAGVSLRRFESFPHHSARGRSSVGRASAFQAEGRGFEPRRPLCAEVARVAQSVERVLGKDEVTGSIPVASSARHEMLRGEGVRRARRQQGVVREH